MEGPNSHTYFSQRLRLHYVDWGNEQAPPLLLVHGGRDHCRNWDWVAEALRDDYHIIAPDLRGYGDTEAQSSTSPVENMHLEHGRTVLQGVEGGMAWSILIDQASGMVSGSRVSPKSSLFA